MKFHPIGYADVLFRQAFGYGINWKHPRDLNEWINYLAFKTDTTLWTELSDKYKVREYVAEKGLSNLLVPLLAIWKNPEEITFDKLPNSFAIKTNCSSGDTIIVNNKTEIDLATIKERMRRALAERMSLFRKSAELHYLKIEPRILCEELIPSCFTTDYKIWCFHGEPFCILVCANRNIESRTVDLVAYDLKWNKHNEWLTDGYRNEVDIERPVHFNEMIEYAKVLSDGFPEVRVDFYDSPQRTWFGEMTFTSYQGRMPYYTPSFQKMMGDKVAEFAHSS